MSAQPIRQLGDRVLREVSRRAETPGDTCEVLADLRDTLHEFRRTHGFGRGISAIQIGVPLRVIYIEFEGTPYCLVNPEFDFLSEDRFHLWDDCFSFPQILVWLERSTKVRIRYQDETGANRELEAAGPLSELIQHEMDHLDGILAIDRADGLWSVMPALPQTIINQRYE
jgi:peptide deformylase